MDRMRRGFMIARLVLAVATPATRRVVFTQPRPTAVIGLRSSGAEPADGFSMRAGPCNDTDVDTVERDRAAPWVAQLLRYQGTRSELRC